jgi:hypothetical protein
MMALGYRYLTGAGVPRQCTAAAAAYEVVAREVAESYEFLPTQVRCVHSTRIESSKVSSGRSQVVTFPVRLSEEYNTGRNRLEEERDIIEYECFPSFSRCLLTMCAFRVGFTSIMRIWAIRAGK